jgi:hypothetical protein
MAVISMNLMLDHPVVIIINAPPTHRTPPMVPMLVTAPRHCICYTTPDSGPFNSVIALVIEQIYSTNMLWKLSFSVERRRHSNPVFNSHSTPRGLQSNDISVTVRKHTNLMSARQVNQSRNSFFRSRSQTE